MNGRTPHNENPSGHGHNSGTPGGRVESAVQVAILLLVGTVAGAASFTHVHAVAASHGQPGWLAWADAVVLELMSITTGLEIRRRHRTGRPAGFVAWVLVAAVVLSLSAQVVQAEHSIVGWLAAALPALGFLACIKIVLARTPAVPTPATPARDQATPPAPTPATRTTTATRPVFDRANPATTDPAPVATSATRTTAATRAAADPHPTPPGGMLAPTPTPTPALPVDQAAGVSGGPGALTRTGAGLVPVTPGAFTRTTPNGGGR